MKPNESYLGGAAGLAGEDAGSASLFGQVMGLVAVALGFLTLGAYLGRHLSEGTSLVFFIIGFLCIAGLNFARSAESLAMVLLDGGALALGLGLGGGLVAYAEADPGAVWQAAAATTLFVASLGALGYLVQADLSGGYRVMSLLLLGLIAYGFVSLFVAMPGGNVAYSLLGLAIFGGYTMLDFNRMRRAGIDEAVQLAAGVFLDIVNIFLFFLRLGNRGSS
jgi:modulator of FtsH protease